MTLIPRQEEKHCFIACGDDKVKSGLCDCINRMQKQALNIPDVVVPKGTLCRCECEMPDIDGRKGLCGRCERPIIV